ncbi:MAG: phenylalanyl-tRNA ligase subunit alpha [candidate division WS6 bacterium GW2011_GWC1_36_11]|uniref:Phenylalanine--tRNA ligase alpha subunit n=3 Tax=Candidatus Dojkabacteria TaxID=74243 RepID=A0A0G0GMJ1_9BACT|nr:MAG: phenylalanyl-tRNA ligase subunit alpha [candidate division WS6 bacterium GW2011_GWC1_36_11]KKQ04587.1 MAG: phenylalanyl-tRNA ligase subunit alpha [candidate division WS6 bacterium GW2011_WS6_36_26]KKQ11223.1 MAG: phenylalanyl-tRNA ligase subunit alpha [candidate division WS6 bacterium GW2011_GWE1_36_69]KKQ12203.1 MAG: phenylalanyl-tRNA ligase subunit alpha [candidate division WS6 bacterium GW2011_GWC2_36_7]KKQ16838.1 MAG: phenylalanyl-tRNA ligase subunit alpha [candidate division WS6 ba
MDNNLEKIQVQLQKDIDLPYDELKTKYISTNGLLTLAMKAIASIPNDQKAAYGKGINQLKNSVTELLDQKKNQSLIYSPNNRIDPTAPFDVNTPKNDRPQVWDIKGTKHPLHKEVEKLVEIFQRMGFDVMESKQMDDDYHMFESLNFPVGHPARDMYDTFWTEDGFVLPAHTSTMQNRALKQSNPPIRVVLPGRVFRHEATDASHGHTFYQMEGIYVDKGISLANMKATIKTFLEAYLETDLEVRIQPSFFPFTEPDCEFVISCPFCNKTGCSTCGHSGWIELMGCGMIHPNVLTQGGIDPEIYSGFAWGFGVDRLTMIKLAINDIRYLRDSNLNFLRQF